jgi:hypothetical protein
VGAGFLKRFRKRHALEIKHTIRQRAMLSDVIESRL